jgi:AbiU2
VDDAEKRYSEKMGPELGTQFHALWKEVVWLHWNWRESVELFGSRPSRVELLNQTASAFFRMTQDALWELTVLHIARLTDSPKSRGRANLTIQNLPDLVKHSDAKETMAILVDTAVTKANFLPRLAQSPYRTSRPGPRSQQGRCPAGVRQQTRGEPIARRSSSSLKLLRWVL